MSELRDELLDIKGVGPMLADQIMAAVEVHAVPASAGPPDDYNSAAVDLLRDQMTGANHNHGCFACGIDGCSETCAVWKVVNG